MHGVWRTRSGLERMGDRAGVMVFYKARSAQAEVFNV